MNIPTPDELLFIPMRVCKTDNVNEWFRIKKLLLSNRDYYGEEFILQFVQTCLLNASEGGSVMIVMDIFNCFENINVTAVDILGKNAIDWSEMKGNTNLTSLLKTHRSYKQ